eukprot:SAG31_NODE_34801_length_329_cov_0.717391_1_plen_90_part_01
MLVANLQIEPLILDPYFSRNENCKSGGCPIYVVRNACFAYMLSKEQDCGKLTTDVYDGARISNPQYRWSVSDTSTLDIHEETGAITAMDL